MQVSAPDRDQLRSLAELRLDRPVVLSLYLNLDPSQFATARPRCRCARCWTTPSAASGTWAASRDDKLALQAHWSAAGFLENDLPSDGAHGLAVFASEPVGCSRP